MEPTNTPAPSSTQPTAPAQSTPPSPLPIVAESGTGLSIAKMLVEQTIDTTGAAKLARAGGVSMVDLTNALKVLRESAEPKEQDVRTPEQKTLDEQFPAAAPEGFLISYAKPNEPDVPMTPELTAFDQSARAWMSEAGLPRDLGNSLVTTIERVTAQTQKMTADQLVAYGEAEFAKLQRVYGNTLEDRLHQVALMVHDLEQKRPGLKQLLKTGGIGDNALVVSMLIQQAERYHARRTKP